LYYGSKEINWKWSVPGVTAKRRGKKGKVHHQRRNLKVVRGGVESCPIPRDFEQGPSSLREEKERYLEGDVKTDRGILFGKKTFPSKRIGNGQQNGSPRRRGERERGREGGGRERLIRGKTRWDRPS